MLHADLRPMYVYIKQKYNKWKQALLYILTCVPTLWTPVSEWSHPFRSKRASAVPETHKYLISRSGSNPLSCVCVCVCVIKVYLLHILVYIFIIIVILQNFD